MFIIFQYPLQTYANPQFSKEYYSDSADQNQQK